MEKTIRSFLYVIVISGMIFTSCGTAAVEVDEKDADAILDAEMPVQDAPVEEVPSIKMPANDSVVPKTTVTPVKESTYIDGVYSASGSYQSPAQMESIGVSMTLKSDKITGLVVTPKATDETSKFIQQLFVDGVNQLVVGKKIDELGSLSQVNGSSLTPIGFNQAVAQIKVQAAR